MKTRTIKQNLAGIFLAAILVTLVAGCSDEEGPNPFSSYQEVYGEDIDFWIDAEGIHRIEVTTVNGSIEVEGISETGVIGGSAGQIHIVAIKEIGARSRADAEDFAGRVEIQTVREGDMIRVFSDYPEPPSNIQVSVSFEIECPREIDLNLQTINGACRVTGMIAEAQVSTTNGNVIADMVELTGGSLFTTVNGAVDVRIQDGIAPLTGSTVNGSVSLRLHSGFGGVLNAQAVHGEITCNFPIHDEYRVFPDRLSGILGTGGSVPVTLSTVNGNVFLDRL